MVIPAIIRDISPIGAGLEIAKPLKLPDHYYLVIDGFAEQLGCAQIHRDRLRLGVKFTTPLDQSMMLALARKARRW